MRPRRRPLRPLHPPPLRPQLPRLSQSRPRPPRQLHPQPRPPAWETFHINELVPWVDATFATQPIPGGRAIAGLSSGGAGSAKYAAAHPGLFGFAGMFSGALDTDLVDSAITAELLGDDLGRAPPQVRGVHKGVKLAFL